MHQETSPLRGAYRDDSSCRNENVRDCNNFEAFEQQCELSSCSLYIKSLISLFLSFQASDTRMQSNGTQLKTMENVHERNGMLVYWSWFQISASQTKEFSGSDKDTTRQIIAPPKGLPTLTAVGSMQRHPPGALKAEKVDWMMTNDWEGSKPFPTSPDVQCDLPRNLPKMKAMISESKAAERIVWFIIVMVVCDRTILYDHQQFGTVLGHLFNLWISFPPCPSPGTSSLLSPRVRGVHCGPLSKLPAPQVHRKL